MAWNVQLYYLIQWEVECFCTNIDSVVHYLKFQHQKKHREHDGCKLLCIMVVELASIEHIDGSKVL